MIELIVLALIANGLLGILLKVAIACVVIWAIFALLAWAGVTIPPPVRIILIALGCILLIYWLFEIFGSLT
jgi:uncharacterized RDD family membrane protein YckC